MVQSQAQGSAVQAAATDGVGADINAIRASVWQLLSSLYAKELTRERLSELAEASDFWQAIGQDDALKQAAVTIEAALLEASRDGSEDARLELAADFCSAFLQNAKHCAAPYASIYLGDSGSAAGLEQSIYGEKHQLMSDYLRSAGLGLASEFREPSDHLAVILSLMAHLCTSASVDSQRDFVQSALISWLPAFTARLSKLTLSSPLYAALGDFTLAWARLDAEGLKH